MKRSWVLRRVAVIVAVGVTAGAGPPALAQTQAVEVERHAGAGRVETAAAISQAHFPSAQAVVVTRADAFPDALAAGPFAAEFEAPLLLTDGAALSPATRDEIVRLGASTFLVLGGEAAVSDAVVEEIAALGLEGGRRAGEDRYATAAALFGNRTVPAEVVLASGASYPDALAAGGLLPDQILLTDPAALPAPTDSLLAEPSVQRVIIVGGPAAITPAVEAQLTGRGLQVLRLAGDDRYATALRIFEQAVARLPDEPRPLIVVTGVDYPDALAGGALAARLQAPILLVPPDGLTTGIAEALRGHAGRFDRVEILGGEQALPQRVADQVAAAARGETVCDPAYPDFCIPPRPPNLDCGSRLIAGRTNFRVLPPDPHHFDADRDGRGCDAGPDGLSTASAVTATGIGPVTVGMTVEQAQAAAQTPLVVEPFDPACYYAGPTDPALERLSFMVTDDTIGTVDIFTPNFATDRGIRVGAPESEVLAAYPGQVVVEDHVYVEGGHYLTVTDPADSGHGLVFETDGTQAQAVTDYRAGRFPDVQYIEGCA